MMKNYKFTSEYLSLYGLEILNKSDEQTLFIDSDGNISMKGSITLGTGSKIEWANIDETGSAAYSKANSAYDYADSAYSKASTASSKASTASNNVAKLANGTYTSGTFISGKEIASPRISAAILLGSKYYNQTEKAYIEIGVGSGSNYADFSVFRNNSTTPVFQIYDEGTSISFKKSGTEFMYTSGSTTYPEKIWDFKYATIQNLKVVAKFG